MSYFKSIKTVIYFLFLLTFALPIISSSSATDLLPECGVIDTKINLDIENQFESKIIENTPGPCDWHKNSEGYGDYFISDVYKTSINYKTQEPIEINFELNTSMELPWANIFRIDQQSTEGCEGDKVSYIRLGYMDSGYYLTLKDKNLNNISLEKSIDHQASDQKFVTISIMPIEGDWLSVKIFLNETELFNSKTFAPHCNESNIKLGIFRPIEKDIYLSDAALTFDKITISGQLALKSDKLFFAHTMDNNEFAVCNDGSPASFYSSHKLNENFPDKIMIKFEGGGAALSVKSSMTKFAEAYDKRPTELMSSHVAVQDKQMKGISNTILHKGVLSDWGVIFLPYCSSDLYMGDHEIKLSGKTYQVRGRRIVNELFESLIEKSVINSETELLLIGGSAGDFGISANLDVIEKLQVKKLRALFTIWITPSQLKYIEERQASTNKIVPDNALRFVNGNLPKNCSDLFVKCGPTAINISNFDIDDYFIEQHWNDMSSEIFVFTTMHMPRNNKNKGLFNDEIRDEINNAGGGFAFLTDEPLLTNKKFNHVLYDFAEPLGNTIISPQEIVWNWISDNGSETKFIFE